MSAVGQLCVMDNAKDGRDLSRWVTKFFEFPRLFMFRLSFFLILEIE